MRVGACGRARTGEQRAARIAAAVETDIPDRQFRPPWMWEVTTGVGRQWFRIRPIRGHAGHPYRAVDTGAV